MGIGREGVGAGGFRGEVVEGRAGEAFARLLEGHGFDRETALARRGGAGGEVEWGRRQQRIGQQAGGDEGQRAGQQLAQRLRRGEARHYGEGSEESGEAGG